MFGIIGYSTINNFCQVSLAIDRFCPSFSLVDNTCVVNIAVSIFFAGSLDAFNAIGRRGTSIASFRSLVGNGNCCYCVLRAAVAVFLCFFYLLSLDSFMIYGYSSLFTILHIALVIAPDAVSYSDKIKVVSVEFVVVLICHFKQALSEFIVVLFLFLCIVHGRVA